MLPEDAVKIAEGIRDMRIRGAGQIARSAVEALVITARASKAQTVQAFIAELTDASQTLLHTRPTAVSLPNGIRYVMHRVDKGAETAKTVDDLIDISVEAGETFIENAKTAVQRIGEIGARRIADGDVLLTHCNSSAAISVMRNAWESGKRFEVFVTETRPRFQGHLTASELRKTGIPVTMILDDAVRYFMQEVDKVIVGADAITANGALVNKIGTSMVALAAHEAKVKVYAAAETYKFSPETMIGDRVKIEERDQDEIISQKELDNIGPIKIRNPSFDVTPPEYIDLIITEWGIIPPLGAILILQDVFGVITAEELQEYQTYAIQEE